MSAEPPGSPLINDHWRFIILPAQNDNLQIHEEKNKGVYVKGLSDYYVGDQDDVYTLMRQGGSARAVSSTNMNAESSRSHSIFLVAIQQKNTDTGTQKTGNLYLVDLAGSEKVGKTGASGQTLEEAKKINKSLSALGMVINALTDGKVSGTWNKSVSMTFWAMLTNSSLCSPLTSHTEIRNLLVSFRNHWEEIRGQP